MKEGEREIRIDKGTERQSARLSNIKIFIARACSGPHRDEGSVTPERVHTHRETELWMLLQSS